MGHILMFDFLSSVVWLKICQFASFAVKCTSKTLFLRIYRVLHMKLVFMQTLSPEVLSTRFFFVCKIHWFLMKHKKHVAKCKLNACFEQPFHNFQNEHCKPAEAFSFFHKMIQKLHFLFFVRIDSFSKTL